jgi:hypothetical protein
MQECKNARMKQAYSRECDKNSKKRKLAKNEIK